MNKDWTRCRFKFEGRTFVVRREAAVLTVQCTAKRKSVVLSKKQSALSAPLLEAEGQVVSWDCIKASLWSVEDGSKKVFSDLGSTLQPTNKRLMDGFGLQTRPFSSASRGRALCEGSGFVFSFGEENDGLDDQLKDTLCSRLKSALSAFANVLKVPVETTSPFEEVAEEVRREVIDRLLKLNSYGVIDSCFEASVKLDGPAKKVPWEVALRLLPRVAFADEKNSRSESLLEVGMARLDREEFDGGRRKVALVAAKDSGAHLVGVHAVVPEPEPGIELSSAKKRMAIAMEERLMLRKESYLTSLGDKLSLPRDNMPAETNIAIDAVNDALDDRFRSFGYRMYFVLKEGAREDEFVPFTGARTARFGRMETREANRAHNRLQALFVAWNGEQQ